MKKIHELLLISMLFLMASCGTDFMNERPTVQPASKEDESQKETAEDDEDEENAGGEENTENGNDSEGEVLYEETDTEREWTIMLYMAADNNLESDAITDFNELENADFDDSVTVLVLLDRAENYDATNGDWTDTRLFRLRHDDQKNKATIVSTQLDCDELGLTVADTTELDMANQRTLAGFMEFSRRAYPANNYALLIWGHGTGWRNCDDDLPCESIFRAFAVDNASDSYMTISRLGASIREGMEDDKLSIIAFDTCFGVCLECAYELSDCASYMLGTPALEPESGWNYTAFLNQLMESGKTEMDFISAASENFAELYKNYAYAAFSCIELSKIPAVVEEFSSYAGGLAETISSEDVRDVVFEIFTDKAVSYCSTSYPTDFSVDFADVVSHLDSFLPSEKLMALVSDSLVYSWSSSGKTSSLGLFFCVYRSAGVISDSHPSMYVNGSRDTNLGRFVRDCSGYVPTSDRSGSLLDKLFYENF